MIDEMRNDVRTAPEPASSNASMASLLSGIVKDVQELTSQQFALFKEEMKQDFHKVRDVAISLALGLAALMIGSIMLGITVAEFLNWATALPRWVCYLIVTGVAAGGGVALFYAGQKKLQSFNPLPDQSVRALKENVQCLTNPR